MSNTHLERTLTEILKKLEKAERDIASLKKNKLTVIDSHGKRASSVASNDHRFLENLNSESYTHLTREEYSRLKNVTGRHGSLTELDRDDHKQYILHKLSTSSWDILAGTGDSKFEKKSYTQLINKIAENIYPAKDKADAVRISKADSTSPVVIIDTASGRVGINTVPESAFHAKGNITFSDGDIRISGSSLQTPQETKPVKIISDVDLDVSVNKDIKINAANITTNAHLKSGKILDSERDDPNDTGWEILPSGDASFRSVEATEIRAKIVATSSETSIGSRQTLCKSSSTLTRAFAVPEPSGMGEVVYIYVHSFSDTPETPVFNSGDIIKLTEVNLFNSEYNTNTCWLTVSGNMAAVGQREQRYAVTRAKDNDDRIAGDCKSGVVIPFGALVLNYGAPNTGAGLIFSTVV